MIHAKALIAGSLTIVFMVALVHLVTNYPKITLGIAAIPITYLQGYVVLMLMGKT